MKNLIYTICSPCYNEVVTLSAPSVISYCLRVNADFKIFTNEDLPNEDSPKSRQQQFMSKFSSMLKVPECYDKVMYIDGDIFIKPDAGNIFELPINKIGGKCTASSFEKRVRLAKVALQIFPDFNKNCLINGGVFLGDYKSMMTLCSETLKLMNSAGFPIGYVVDEVYIAEAIRTHFQEYTDIGEDWNIGYDLRKEHHNFIHCMSRSVHGKIEQLRSLI